MRSFLEREKDYPERLRWTILSSADELFRAPLILFYLEDHSYLEIAEILKIPPGTVMSRISRGRAMLRQLMEDKPGNVVPLETSLKTAAS